MFKNYFKTAWRNFARNKILSFINLSGLSISIAAVLFIGLYIYGEANYDNFQKNSTSLYRVGFQSWKDGKLLGNGADFTAQFAPDAKNEFPEIKSFTRYSSERIAYIKYKDKVFKIDNIHYTDSTFFQLLSYKLLQGNPLTVLNEPYSIVLTIETARKLFGDDSNNYQDVIGKTIQLDNQTNYTITGIAQEAPSNSHLSYNALISFTTLYKEPDNYMGWNGGEQYSTYLQLHNRSSAHSLETKFPSFLWKHINESYSKAGFKIEASLQPIRDIHLYYSDNSASLRTNIYIFSIVALLILIISCVNYINLTTAKGMTRFKEIGVRKVLGAGRSQLIKQFLTETIFMTIIAFFISILFVAILIPSYQKITGKSLPALEISTIPAILFLFIVILITGVIAGSYVAFYLSSVNATKIFKSSLPGSSRNLFRKGLIMGQFAITIGLMVCTVIVTQQLQYSKKVNLGFDKDHIIVLPLVGKQTQASYPVLQQELSQIASVQQVSGLSEIPYDGITTNGFIPEGDTKAIFIHQLDADDNFLKTFSIKMVSGDFFAKERPTLSDGYVINETLANVLGWENPVGKIINRNGAHKVIGVIKDFHFASLHDKIEPLIITNKPWEGQFSFLAIKYQTANTPAFIDDIKQTWKKTFAGAPIDYWFLDEAYNKIYKSDEKFQQVFIYFSVLSIILSLAGVFGLVILALKQRTKEFGVRKILGAKIIDIIKLTAKDFAGLIILGAIIISPVAWYYTNKWLENFAYRIQLSWRVFVFCSLSILLITILTISIQAAKAAITNPVKSLRTE
ncbi:MAG: ABC transporter permease [Bacteroidetes bacterium]|nr:ABC transporter permease [Bacteroidota bacterium]